MSYQALYRVWRPQTFDELVGQRVITETLKNAIANQQTSHAYLFTGPRGTGKTSAAKIFAKAINCPHQSGGNPCNQCEICQAISQGQLSDVVEIDAASNNGVDEIRNLRDNVRYAASQAKYKVYIIDEVHMLTTGAFNALLKTLEEPPAGVIFILATTEPHKIPATIISRTQRFDFQRITQKHLVNRMVEILEHDQIAYDIQALEIIARAANGAMRDSLSLLDQVLSYNNQAVKVDSALEVSGSLSQLAFVDYLLAIYQGQGEVALQVLDKQLQKGKQANRFVEELILFARDVLLSSFADLNQTLLSSQELEVLTKTIPADYYYKLIDHLNLVQDKMRFSSQTDLYLEVMTIQLAQGIDSNKEGSQIGQGQDSSTQPQLQDQFHHLQAQVQALESQIKRLQDQIQTRSTTTQKFPSVEDKSLNDNDAQKDPVTESEAIARKPRQRPQFEQANYHLAIQDIYHVLNQATHQDINRMKSHWDQVLASFSPQDRAKFVGVEPLAAGHGLVLLGVKDPILAGALQHDAKVLENFYQHCQKLMGQAYYYLIIADKDWPNLRSDYTVLRRNQGGQPIDIPETSISQLESQINQMKERLIEEEETHADDLSIQSLVDQAIQVQPRSEDIDLNVNEIEEELNHPKQVPDHVTKAIELFGEENVNVIFDE